MKSEKVKSAYDNVFTLHQEISEESTLQPRTLVIGDANNKRVLYCSTTYSTYYDSYNLLGVPAKAIFGPNQAKRCIFQIFFSYYFYSKFADTRYLPTLVIPLGASIHTACAHFRTPSMCCPAKSRPSVRTLTLTLPPDFVVPLDNS